MKQYQNVTFKELLLYSENNPNRTRELESIEIHDIKPDTSLEKIGLKGFNSFDLNPTGILSLIACINDPTYYSLIPVAARIQLTIDIATKLQLQTDQLKNTSISRKRKKLHDLIGAAYNGSAFEEKDYFELFSGLSIMCNIQFILIKSAVQEDIENATHNGLKGEIVFSSNPTNWKSDVPVWITDYHARWIAIPSSSTHPIIATWLTDIENTGWIIKWPEVDGTKSEIVEYLSLLPTWKATDTKINKDILAVRLGRANCIKVFSKWN